MLLITIGIMIYIVLGVVAVSLCMMAKAGDGYIERDLRDEY
jgi:hypothetical protein